MYHISPTNEIKEVVSQQYVARVPDIGDATWGYTTYTALQATYPTQFRTRNCRSITDPRNNHKMQRQPMEEDHKPRPTMINNYKFMNPPKQEVILARLHCKVKGTSIGNRYGQSAQIIREFDVAGHSDKIVINKKEPNTQE